MPTEPTQVWMNNSVEQMALLYRGDGSGSLTLGRHHLQADVPVRPASLEEPLALSRIAVRISTGSLSIIRAGNSKIEIEGKNGSHVELSADHAVSLEDADAIWFPFRPALRWQVVWGQGAVSLQLVERPLPITHVLPVEVGDFDEWRTRWGANWCARDAAGWHVDELVAAGEISPRVASLIAHVYRA